jgi:hypothetical protein
VRDGGVCLLKPRGRGAQQRGCPVKRPPCRYASREQVRCSRKYPVDGSSLSIVFRSDDFKERDGTRSQSVGSRKAIRQEVL